MKTTTRVFFTEVDAWFDTTIATLGAMNPQRAIELMGTKDYTYRLFNEFEGFDHTEFEARWKARDRQILADALITRVPGLFADFLKRSQVETHSTPFQYDVELVLNFYPYRMTREEVAAICKKIYATFPVQFMIRPVFLTPKQINPMYIRTYIDVLALYNFNEWLGVHITNEDFVKYPCYEKVMHAPLVFPRKIEGMGRKEFIQNVQNTISFLTPMIGLLYHSSEIFTTLLSPRLKEGEVGLDPNDPKAMEKYLQEQGVSDGASSLHNEALESLDPPPLDWELLRASRAFHSGGGTDRASGLEFDAGTR
jgi:hypothetical protein